MENCEDEEAELMAAKLAENRHCNLRTLTWTSAKPTVPGWYWRRLCKGDTPKMFHVVEDDNGYGVFLDVGDGGGEWAGPIAAPQERTGS